MINKYTIAALSSVFVAVHYARKNIKKVQEIASNLSIKLFNINNLKIVGNNSAFNSKAIELNIDLQLINNSNHSFNVEKNSLINITKLEFFNADGVKLAQAEKHIDNIILTANGSTILQNINVLIPTKNLAENVINLLSSNINITPKAHITIFGKQTVI